jgi:hypothetical protein
MSHRLSKMRAKARIFLFANAAKTPGQREMTKCLTRSS